MGEQLPIVAVVGSRAYGDLARVQRYVTRLVENGGVTLISGGAKGVDTAAADAAVAIGRTPIVMLPDYERHGRGATWKRNEALAARCHRMVAFWDGRSSGTLHAIGEAAKLDKPVEINPPDFVQS